MWSYYAYDGKDCPKDLRRGKPLRRPRDLEDVQCLARIGVVVPFLIWIETHGDGKCDTYADVGAIKVKTYIC